MLEICLPLYKRHDKLPRLLRSLANQTNSKFYLNIWNNDPTKWVDTRNLGKKRIRVFQGIGNEGSAARFKMLPKINGSPIIFIDDDMELDHDFVQYYSDQHKKYGKDCILGWYNKRWKSDDYEDVDSELPEGEEVDYVGTGGMILDRAIFDKEPSFQNIPQVYKQVEDLYLSAIARQKYGMRLYSIDAKCKINTDGIDQHHDLRSYKPKAFAQLRENGWKLLYDEPRKPTKNIG